MPALMNEGRQPPGALFAQWYIVWFILALLISLAGGIMDQLNGGSEAGFNAWGAGISLSVLLVLVLLVWRQRERLENALAKLSWAPAVKAVLIGWFFAEIDELVCYPFNPLYPGITILQDIVLTTPTYVIAHLAWYWILRRYRFSVREAFFAGGISLGLMELILDSAGVLVLLSVIIWPLQVMIHGFHMVMPRIALSSHLESLEQKESRWKYPLGVLVPLAGAGIGVGIALLIGTALFNME